MPGSIVMLLKMEMERSLGTAVALIGSLWILGGGWEPEGTPTNWEQRMRDTVHAIAPNELGEVVPGVRIVADMFDYISGPRPPRALVQVASRNSGQMTPHEVRDIYGQIGIEAGLFQLAPAKPRALDPACMRLLTYRASSWPAIGQARWRLLDVQALAAQKKDRLELPAASHEDLALLGIPLLTAGQRGERERALALAQPRVDTETIAFPPCRLETPQPDKLTFTGLDKQYDNLADAGGELLNRLRTRRLDNEDRDKLKTKFGPRLTAELVAVSRQSETERPQALHKWIKHLQQL